MSSFSIAGMQQTVNRFAQQPYIPAKQDLAISAAIGFFAGIQFNANPVGSALFLVLNTTIKQVAQTILSGSKNVSKLYHPKPEALASLIAPIVSAVVCVYGLKLTLPSLLTALVLALAGEKINNIAKDLL